MGFMPAHPSFYCLRSLYSTYGKFRLEYKVAADFDQLFRLLFINRIRTQYIPMDFVTMPILPCVVSSSTGLMCTIIPKSAASVEILPLLRRFMRSLTIKQW